MGEKVQDALSQFLTLDASEILVWFFSHLVLVVYQMM